MIRIGIVGCGRILAAHLRGYRRLRAAGVDSFRITALCSRDRTHAEMYVRRDAAIRQRPAVSTTDGDPLAVGDEFVSDFQDDIAVGIYDDFREMIADGPVDAVNDFTSHGLHHVVADCAATHGKHLLTQKPLAVTVAAARRMCEQFKAAGLTLGTFENWRFRPRTRHLRWLFEASGTDDPPGGRLQAILMGNMGSWWVPNRVVANTPWRHDRLSGGGISLDLGAHQFDLIRHVAGEVANVQARTTILEPQRVVTDNDGVVIDRVHCDADDTFYASFETATGVTGNLFASWAGHGAPTVPGNGPVFYGTQCRVAGAEVNFDDGTTAQLADLYRSGCDSDRRQREFPFGLDDEFALAQWDWLRAIAGGTQPEVSGREGLLDLACAFALVESSLAGRRVTIDEILDGTVGEYQAGIARHHGLPC